MSATFDPETYAREQERINRTHPQPNGAADHGPVRKLDIVWADSIEIDLSRSGLVDGLLDRSGLTVLYGPSGSGKTFVALDLACHVAAGRAWRSHMVAPGVVVYCAAESPTSVERRTWAWKRHHGVEHLPLVIVRSSLDLLNGDTDAVLALLAGIGREHGRVALVVVDTLARAMVGNENSPEDMGKFVSSCGRIKEAADTHVLVVHHAGKDEARGARGHSCLRAATDTELEVTKGGETGSIRVTKNRDAEEGLAFGFRLDQVELGTRAGGHAVTTCVAIPADAPSGGGKRRPIRETARLVLDAFTAALADRADDPPPAVDIPRGARGVTVARWEQAALRYLPHTEQKRRKEAFNRGMASLVAAGMIRHVGGFAWLP